MDCIADYNPTVIITHYLLPIFAQHRPISPCRPLALPINYYSLHIFAQHRPIFACRSLTITDHKSPITDKITAEDTVIFTTKSTKEAQKTQR